MKWIEAAAIVAIGVLAASGQEKMPTADAVLADLKAGNAHHVAKQYLRPNQTAERQRALAGGQNPHCGILTCADSRVPPEIVFDRGLGDLFDVRVAGNVAGDDELASIEYAAEHFDLPLIVVMGHSKCGAVDAAVKGGELHGKLPQLIGAIRPAVDRTKGMPGDPVANAVRANVENVVNQLRGSRPVLAELVAKGRLRIVGAVYSIETGKVDWLPEAAAK